VCACAPSVPRGRLLERLEVSRGVLRQPRGGAPTAGEHVVDLVVAARVLGVRLLTLDARVVVDPAPASGSPALDRDGRDARGLELVDATDR
jgi:hypothetical protein